MLWQDPLEEQPSQALLRTVFTQAAPDSVRRTIPCSVANFNLAHMPAFFYECPVPALESAANF
jgi:hypothetical protein